MRRERWWVPLLALIFAISWKPTLALPLPDEEVDTSTKLLGSSVVTSVSVVTGPSENGPASNADRSRVIPTNELPGSPADLLRPDRFQFLDFNKDGVVVTKQMSEQQIHSLIAAGGGHLPMEIHEPQNAGDVPNGGMKVADVVQNVQNVLKGELNKPATVMTSMPTIPGHANTEWSSILPAILGGESESAPVSDPSSAQSTHIDEASVVADTTLVKIPEPSGVQKPATKLPAKEQSTTAGYETKNKPSGMTEAEAHIEKPMIQVPVITVDQKLPAHQEEEDSTPVFQMLNTISAEKIETTNSTNANDKPEVVEPQKADLPDDEKITKPEKPIVKPVVQGPSVESSNVDEEAPEMVEINLSEKTPTEKPGSMIKTTEIVSAVPQTEAPALVSVISETHSTSMKVTGHEEVPMIEPSKPEVTKPIELHSEEKKPMEKPMINVSTDVEMDSTTAEKTGSSATSSQVSDTVTTEKPGFLAQGVSFFGNLPQTVSSLVTDFISNNSPTSKPIVEEADVKVATKAPESLDKISETNDNVKKPENTETSAGQTTPESIRETATSKKPDQEPVYQMIPEIIPNKRVPPHGASPSEASSIEHIIETLNDPTGSISGTVASDHYGAHAESSKPVTVSDSQTSTTATPVNMETPAESSSAKPMEPLPTELADSLSSMISQISDARPSVLPVSEDAGLDTNEKKNASDMQAEEPTDETSKNGTVEVTKASEEPANKTELHSQLESNKSEVIPTKIPETQDQTVDSVILSATTEKLIESATNDESVTTESVKLDDSTAKSDLPSTEKMTELPADKIDTEIQAETTSLANPEKIKPDADPVLAASDVATDKIVPAVLTDASVVIKDATESATTEGKLEEKITTEKSATTVASLDASVVTTVSSDGTERPLEFEAAIAPVALKPESQQSDAPSKIAPIENNTEVTIVHIDITEAKPTDFITNSSTDEDQDNGTESPLVRIQLTDPITLINNMINTASTNASAASVVPLTLPETGSVSPNSIASGLIAGFPSSTQATLERKPTTPNSVKAQPEIEPVIDDSANSTKTSDVQVENITKSATSETTESLAESNTTEKVQVLESSTVKEIPTAGFEITGQSTDLSIESVTAKKPEEETTIQAGLTQQATTDQPKKEESSEQTVSNENAEVSSPSIAEETVSNDQNSTKSSENVTVALEETTTAESTASNAGLVSENGSKASESTISEKLDSGDKLNSSDASKIIETVVSTSAKPETPAVQTDSLETKIQNVTAPGKSGESSNFSIAEIPIVRIDVAPETAPEEMPSKIQLDDLPIVETTATSIKPTEEVKIEAQSSESATTHTPLQSNSNDSMEATTSNSTEKTPLEIAKDKPKLEDAVKESVTESSTVPVSSEKTVETSTIIPTPQQIEEVRIQVNDTAVRVTKRPVSEAPVQMSGDTEKTENQPTDEQSTTPKIVSITEGLVTKLPDKERLPVPTKVSELSYSQDSADSLSQTNMANSSGTETRIRLGEEQGTKESTTMKAEDPRKPIKKNSDSDASQSFESNVTLMESTTKMPSAVNDETSAKDSNAQPSIKVEVATNKTPTPSKINASSKLEDKPIKLNDKKPSVRPVSKPSRPAHKPTMNIKKDDVATEDKWTLIPQQVYPAAAKPSGSHKRPTSTEEPSANVDQSEQKISSSQRPPVPLDHPQSASGLDSTVNNLETDISYFANLCNELAFTFWTATNKGLSTSRSLAVSPFGMTSMLAMVFLGARGPTSDQMNDILRLDDVSSFNPHLVFQNVTDAVGLARNQGIANAAFVRELFADRSKVRKLMPFYKEQAQQFYDGIVAEVNFATISDLVRRRTNLMIRKQTGGRIKDFVRTNTVPLRSPLAAMSANVFQTDCNSSAASSEGRDGELYFAVSPAVRQRKLVPVPATVWRAGVLAGYEPSLDATAIALGGIDKLVSTIFVIPGQQGHTAPGDTLDQLEQRFITGATHDGAWNKLLKVLIPRPGLELQVPKFSHRSVINATAALKRMGLEELFSKHADLKGINGLNTDLHLADVLQMNLFSTCGDENILSGRHHVEVYPGSPLRNAREHHETEEKDEFLNDLADDDTAFSGSATPYEAAPHREARLARQTEGTEKPRLKLDRPFLYFVRHNPTGLILHMGRFNPRLLP